MLLLFLIDSLHDLDQDFLLKINGLRGLYWDSFMFLYSGRFAWAPLYASILFVLIRNFNWRMVLFTVIAFVLVITLTDQVAGSILRPLFERPRPTHDPEIGYLVNTVDGYRGGSYGFPSCHAANTFGLAFFIRLLFKSIRLSLFFLLWAIITCYTRMYLGVHFLGDIIFGMIIGIIAGAIVYTLYKLILRSRFSSLIKVEQNSQSILLHPTAIRYSYVIILTGITTIFAFAIYSIFVVT